MKNSEFFIKITFENLYAMFFVIYPFRQYPVQRVTCKFECPFGMLTIKQKTIFELKIVYLVFHFLCNGLLCDKYMIILSRNGVYRL